MQCKSCRWWLPIKVTNAKPHGQCRGRSPQIVAVDNLHGGEDDPPMRVMSRWPLTQPYDWCDDFEEAGQ